MAFNLKLDQSWKCAGVIYVGSLHVYNLRIAHDEPINQYNQCSGKLALQYLTTGNC